MKTKFILPIICIAFIGTSCSKQHPTNTPGIDTSTNNVSLKIAVISDMHFLDSSLLKNNASNGIAFQAYLKYDPKLIAWIDPILRAVVSQLISEKPDILL